MGYQTDFSGSIAIDPVLDQGEIDYLWSFVDSRRMYRTLGPYHVGSGVHGQGDDADILGHNTPPEGQPGLWCGWIPTDDGSALEWNEQPKFYEYNEWMLYLIQHFLAPTALAKGIVPGVKGGHVLNGKIYYRGENFDDYGVIKVIDNKVLTHVPNFDNLAFDKYAITPQDYHFRIVHDRERDYFKSLFGLSPNEAWTDFVVLADPTTGGMGHQAKAFIKDEHVRDFYVDDKGRMRRQGAMEWEPD